MSNVICKQDKKCLIEATGHATGSVEVCASVSAILQGLIWYLKKWGEDVNVKDGDGYLRIEFGSNFQCITVYRFVVEVLKGISNAEPDYLTVTEIY